MAIRSYALPLCSLAVSFSLAAPLAAQSVEEAKTDVLSALSTPLPITIIGPLLTRDVAVSEEGGGFRATLQDTTLMGLFPFGDVSFRMDPLDDDSYRITDLTFSSTLEFPGIGTLSFSGMEFDGTWSTKSRSYSALKWLTNDVKFTPDMGAAPANTPEPQASISLGSLMFDVLKEPDSTNTESKFEITAGNVAMIGMGPQNVTLGEVRALLAANGDKPVDLYSVLREVLMLGTVRNGGAHLQTLGQSLLGNTYDTVTLDLSATNLNMASVRRQNEYFQAGTLHATAALKDVQPRTWGGAEIVLRFGNVDQREALPDSALRVGEAVVRFTTEELPVADMMATFMTLGNPPRRRPVDATALLNGLMEFGKLEIASEGKNVWFDALYHPYRNGQRATEAESEFALSFDSWGVNFGLAGLNRNEGTLSVGTVFSGGKMIPGESAPADVLPHLNAWFPKELAITSSVTKLNEGLLKQMFKDVTIHNLQEPVEIITPLVIYAASTVMEMTSGMNVYETGLFRLEQEGSYRFYPSEVLSLFPYEGEATMRMTGLPELLAYFDDTMAKVRPGSYEVSGLSAVKSGLIVLRNLAKEGDGGALEWAVARSDISKRELTLNDVTLRYPDFAQYMPMFAFMGAMRF
ncbi:hypothetical protein N4R57_17180 [Rhodobacteraceae bacterium D3-12]|nr:hypothetical protein N4R57_17180 [Rhodobacteraceae bacterium D3-12]